MNKVYRVSDYIADFISEKKIKHVFLLPGGGNMHLVDAVAKSKKLHPISLLHEQAVSISSEAYSRINNNIDSQIIIKLINFNKEISSFSTTIDVIN